MSDLIARAIAHAETLGWRDIESAPKDGTAILCRDDGPYDDELVSVMGWLEAESEKPYGDKGSVQEYLNTGYDEAGWAIALEPSCRKYAWPVMWKPIDTSTTPDPTRTLLLALADRVRVLEEAWLVIDSAIDETHQHWDADQDSKVGKMLMSLLGDLKGYRRDIDDARRALGAADSQGEG